MKYIKDQELPVWHGKPLALSAVLGTDKHVDHASLRETLWWLLDNYFPNPQAGMVLDNPGLRSRTKVMDILAGEPQEQGYYRFENVDWDVLKKVVGWMGPYMSTPAYSPVIEDILGEAVDKVGEDSGGEK